jgi:hypothetical protein
MRDERTTRICTSCKQEKRTDEFPMKVASFKQGHRRYRSHVCADCKNDQQRAWFAKHPDVRQKSNRDYRNKSDPRYAERHQRTLEKQRNQRLLNYAFMDAEKARGCLVCGERDWRVLQFDHVRGKTASIAAYAQNSTVVFLAELDRCDVVCANCHARRTHERRLLTRSTSIPSN